LCRNLKKKCFGKIEEDIYAKVKEKYIDCKRFMDKRPLVSLISGNYRKLKKYYESEIRNLSF
jgi:hypothetical protein